MLICGEEAVLFEACVPVLRGGEFVSRQSLFVTFGHCHDRGFFGMTRMVVFPASHDATFIGCALASTLCPEVILFMVREDFFVFNKCQTIFGFGQGCFLMVMSLFARATRLCSWKTCTTFLWAASFAMPWLWLFSMTLKGGFPSSHAGAFNGCAALSTLDPEVFHCDGQR